MLKATDKPLTETYDVALLDLDGVVYIGADPVPAAADALAAAVAEGMRTAYVTNNAARTPETVAAHLTELGVPAQPRQVVTSAQAAASVLRTRLPAGSAVLVIGGEGLVAALVAAGLQPVFSADDAPVALAQGFSPEVGWRALAEGALVIARGAPWVLSNADLTIPVPRGIAPGNGSLAQVLVAASGREPDVVAGKPYLPLLRESLRRTGATRPLMVGDRLDTDIEGAVRGGIDSLLVLTGVCGAGDLLRAPAHQRPTFVAPDLTGLLHPHPAVRTERGRASCAGWTAVVEERCLRLEGGGDPYDGLRAACAAMWQATDAEHSTTVHAGGDGAGRIDISGMGRLALG